MLFHNNRLSEYKQICEDFPRRGLGVEMHCSDVGLEDPSITAKAHVRTEMMNATTTQNKQQTTTSSTTTTNSYQKWIEQAQVARNANWKFNVALHASENIDEPPEFDKVTLFHNGVEEYAMANTSLVSKSIQDIATETNAQELFSPCMVGSLESQFLKLQVQVCNAKKVLDIGTFTGMSALAMAEGLPKEGQVITLENDDKAANVAEACFQKSETGYKISLIRGNATDSMKKLLKSGEKFDIIFIDADKENYIHYYNLAMEGLLSTNGFILADNSMCAILYDSSDER